ncbi:MAG: aldo/keto reductase [Anaerolineales bacterium]|nr:aldo/keto reductase [Anaerolineales bacterium]
MELRRFGNSDLYVTPMGLGLAALGRPGYINLGHAEDLQGAYDVGSMTLRTHDLLDAAWAAGIRYFDTARSYGRAEQFLASWLVDRGILPDQVTVCSKWGYIYSAGWQVDAEQHEVKDHSLPMLHEQMMTSYDLLGRNLEVYLIHSATPESGVLDNIGVLQELARLRDTGLIIGLSLSGPGQAETLASALRVEVGGHKLFGAVQATWNILERAVEPQLSAAHEAGLAVIVKEGLANGLLTEKNQRPEMQPALHRLGHLAAEMGTTLDALALGFALQQPWATVVLSGAVSVSQLNSNLTALSLDWDRALDEELNQFVEPAGVYWTRRSQLPWN